MCTCHCQTPVVLSEIVIMKTKNPISLTTQVRQRIRQLREQNGLTQDKLCEYAGISSDSITRIEGGSRVPRLDTLEKIARVFDTDVSSLVSTGKMSEPTYPQSIMRIVHLLAQYPEPVHAICEKVLRSALEGFLSVETARLVINKEKRKKRTMRSGSGQT